MWCRRHAGSWIVSQLVRFCNFRHPLRTISDAIYVTEFCATPTPVRAAQQCGPATCRASRAGLEICRCAAGARLGRRGSDSLPTPRAEWSRSTGPRRMSCAERTDCLSGKEAVCAAHFRPEACAGDRRCRQWQNCGRGRTHARRQARWSGGLYFDCGSARGRARGL
jgi:hypothetical protein